jgi:hypothetical protein
MGNMRTEDDDGGLPNMLLQGTRVKFFKSSYSGSDGCVAVAHLPGGDVAVLDSKDPTRKPMIFSTNEWASFLLGVRNGKF